MTPWGMSDRDETIVRAPSDESSGGFQERPSMERRLVLRVLKRWRSIAGDRRYPAHADITAESMEGMWANCFILQLGRFRDDPIFRFCGDSFTHPPGHMLEMTPVSALPKATLIAHAVTFLDEVLDRDVPIARGGGFVMPTDEQVRFRSILLPLSDNDRTLTHLLGAANAKETGE